MICFLFYFEGNTEENSETSRKKQKTNPEEESSKCHCKKLLAFFSRKPENIPYSRGKSTKFGRQYNVFIGFRQWKTSSFEHCLYNNNNYAITYLFPTKLASML